MDAAQCAAALASEDLRPRLAGRAYTLIPVSVGGAFHPKIILQLGKTKGSLLVGSHNVTIAGFGFNDELTNVFHYDAGRARSAVPPFRAATTFLETFLPAQLGEVTEAFDAALRMAPWLEGPVPVTSAEAVVIGSSKDGPSLWSQVVAHVPRPVRRAFVIAPFFDRKLAFLERLVEDLQPRELTVGIDPATVELDPLVARSFPGVRFVDVGGRAPVPRRRPDTRSYLHAKALWFETGEGEVLVTGSANASVAAYLAAPEARNAEAVVVRKTRGADSLSKVLGLDDLLAAPEITETGWNDVRARLEAREEQRRDESAPPALLAVATEDGFTLAGTAEVAAQVRVFDEEGGPCGPARVVTAGPPAQLEASSDVRETAALLDISDREGRRMAIVHRPERIGENFASDTRTALRNALGTLEEDAGKIDALLKLTEKVIFDTDDIVRSHARATGSGSGGGDESEADAGATQPTSLSLEATGRRGAQRRRSIASGDIAVLLDALVRRLGEGLGGNAAPLPAPDEARTTDDPPEDPEPPPPPPNHAEIARMCRGKVKRLVRRMLAQLDLAAEQGTARRAVVQLAAVLSVLRALRIIEQRPEWRRCGQRLLDEESLGKLFAEASIALAGRKDSLLATALAESGEEGFEELSTTVGLMVWLAWETDVDADHAAERDGRVGVEEELWYWVQILSYLAPFFVGDARAMEILKESIERTLRRGVDHQRWISTHVRLLELVAQLAAVPETARAGTRAVRPGDLVVLPERFWPRVRLATEVYPGALGMQVAIVDLDDENGVRKFLTGRVTCVSWQTATTRAASRASA
ncbi:MAG: hypothetical protein QM820_32295 [Minicystis sp.]